MIKDTLKLQITSLVNFANHLGFYLDQNERGLKFFKDESGRLVSINTMIRLHNGNVPGTGMWSKFSEYVWGFKQVFGRVYDPLTIKEAYSKRSVYVVKYRYNKKTAKFVGAGYDNVVKLLPGVDYFK